MWRLLSVFGTVCLFLHLASAKKLIRRQRSATGIIIYEKCICSWKRFYPFFSVLDCPNGVVEEDASFRVFVTINALSYVSWNGNLQSRKLELNWTPPPDGVQDNDQIRLYRRHPEQGEQTRLLVRIRARDHDGYFKTQVSFPRNPMMGIRSPKANCLYGFWIAYIRDERTLKANCIRVRPEWMYEHRHVIGEIPLHGNTF